MGSVAIAEGAGQNRTTGYAASRKASILHAPFFLIENLSREQAVTIFRLAASILLISAAGLHGTEASLRFVLLLYAIYSLIVAASAFVFRHLPRLLLFFIHSSDVFWAALICLFSGILHSPFLVLFLFAPVTAAYRRKALTTIVATAASVSLILLEAVIVNLPEFSLFHLMVQQQLPVAFVVKVSIFLALGVFLSYWAYQSEQEYYAYIARSATQRLHPHAGLQANIKEILPFVLHAFAARRAMLVLASTQGNRLFLWEAQSDRQLVMERRNLSPGDAEKYLWPMPEGSSAMWCSRFAGHLHFRLLDRQGTRFKASSSATCEDFPLDQPFHTLMVSTLQLGSEWTGRLFLVDPSSSNLRLLWQLVRDIAPSMYNFYVSQHIRARVRAIERQRTARELHDGVIQSLIFAEMQVDLLRRQMTNPTVGVNTGEVLSNVQLLLRKEVRDLRCQIEQLRRSSPPRQLLPRIAEMVEKFQCETGISTNFSSEVEVENDSVPARISHEVARIVEEALANIRKHSGARKVEVRLVSRPEGTWQVIIQDDGCGFNFSGRLSLAELKAARLGPRVIQERVHAVDGDLALESHPGRGARLEIQFACK